MTYYLLKFILISIGCYYLESSTSSVELSIFLIIFFTNEHHISHLFWNIYIYFAASHPTVKYSGRQVRTYTQPVILFFLCFYFLCFWHWFACICRVSFVFLLLWISYERWFNWQRDHHLCAKYSQHIVN